MVEYWLGGGGGGLPNFTEISTRCVYEWLLAGVEIRHDAMCRALYSLRVCTSFYINTEKMG